MKKLLFIEAVRFGRYFQDRYDEIADLGIEVFVLYGDGNGEPAEDRYRRVVGSSDFHHLTLAACAWLAEEGFDGVATIAESSIIATAHIAEALDLTFASPRAAVASRHKGRMRQAHEEGGAPHPHFLPIKEIADVEAWPCWRFPVIVKPTMGSLSSFVFRADDPAELRERAETVLANAENMTIIRLEATGFPSLGAPALIETFIPGSEHLVEGYMHDGRFVLGSVVDRITMEGKTFDDDVHRCPSALSPDALEAVENAVRMAVLSQGIVSAPIHAEIRFDGARPVIVETAIRPGGGCLHRMASLCYGYDPLAALVALALGENPGHTPRGPTGTHIVAATLLAEEGEITAIEGVEEVRTAPGAFFLKVVADVGTVLHRPPNGNSVVGFLGVRGDSFEEAKENFHAAARRLRVSVKEMEYV